MKDLVCLTRWTIW